MKRVHATVTRKPFPRRWLLAAVVFGETAAAVISWAIPATELRPHDSRWLIFAIYAVLLPVVAMPVVWLFHHLWTYPPELRVWLWLLLLYTLLTAFVGSAEWRAAQRFVREGREAAGTVIQAYPHDHNMLDVQYQVGNKLYRRRMQADGEARDFPRGTSVKVRYNASDPPDGFLRMPLWRPGSLFSGWIPMAAFMLPCWAVAIGSWVRQWRQTPLGQPFTSAPRAAGPGGA